MDFMRLVLGRKALTTGDLQIAKRGVLKASRKSDHFSMSLKDSSCSDTELIGPLSHLNDERGQRNSLDESQLDHVSS